MSERRFPIQLKRGRAYVPWSVGEEAWQKYQQRFASQTAERIAERGGFGEEEMDEYRPGWRSTIVPNVNATEKH